LVSETTIPNWGGLALWQKRKKVPNRTGGVRESPVRCKRRTKKPPAEEKEKASEWFRGVNRTRFPVKKL